MNTGLKELLGILRGKFLGVGDGGSVADSGIEEVMELADAALALHFPQDVHRQDAVGVRVGIDRVVAAVGSLVSLCRQIVHAGDGILAVVGGGGGLDVVRVALGTMPPEVHRAMVALLRSLMALLGATRSKEGMGYSVV